MKKTAYTFVATFLVLIFTIPVLAAERRPVSREHLRLFGTSAELKTLAERRPQDYQRMKSVALNPDSGDYARMMSIALVNAIEPDAALAREAVKLAMQRIDAPIVTGHNPFGSVLAECAVVYDYCHDQWMPEEREKFINYFNRTVAANVNEETHVFHNGWYGYKNWGYGVAAYATYHENPESPKVLAALEKEFAERTAPALALAGAGGAWAEGYYINYWIYQWTFFCEIARRCEGADYFAMAPEFFKERAVAGMFEMYPGIGIYGSRRPIPMGDGGGRTFGGDRDNTLNSRRILASYYKEDSASKSDAVAHQAVFAFDEATPRSSVGEFAYKDFLWRDNNRLAGTASPHLDLSNFKLSHYSPGAGYVYARSSWDDDATYFFFKCGNRFTAHQHLDVGHFMIYKGGELVGDGGHYDGFGTPHDVNYHLRTIAHNTIRVIDPNESLEVKWRDPIRAGKVTSNDGGQRYDWPQHNGSVADAEQWNSQKKIWETGEILEFKDDGKNVFIKADCTKAYSDKIEMFVREIVYTRPGTIKITDTVRVKNPEHKIIWNLQAMKKPEQSVDGSLSWDNGAARITMKTNSPEKTNVELFCGDDLYKIDGVNYPPERDTGPAPECRVEITPVEQKKEYVFNTIFFVTDLKKD
ncbi:MAG: heparinase II/III-family protein [Kiritimatiellaeota bacterium]|nr:heparinase II/III-family protein [Kiritimatiellota bacterium]